MRLVAFRKRLNSIRVSEDGKMDFSHLRWLFLFYRFKVSKGRCSKVYGSKALS